MLSRRNFIKNSSAFTALSLAGLGLQNSSCMNQQQSLSSIKIAKVNSNFDREPLAKPFGFKGSSISKIWQTAAWIQSESGMAKVGLGVQSVLWSDSSVFAAHTESGGNALMYAMTERALQLIKGMTYTSPIDLLDEILEEVYAYGKKITQNPNLRKTFALNALVGR